MMTTSAAMLGALPLALSFGDGGELRRPLGIAIVGGLMVSQVLTLYTTPVLYLYLDRFRLWATTAAGSGRSRACRRPRRRRNEVHCCRPLVHCCACSPAGCMVGPDYKQPDAPVSPAFKELSGWKPVQPRDDDGQGRVVGDLSRSGAGPAGAAWWRSPTRR